MITQYIAIILDNKVLQTVQVSGKTYDECHERAFEFADTMYGENKDYELFELSNPRSQILFEKELDQLFKS